MKTLSYARSFLIGLFAFLGLISAAASPASTSLADQPVFAGADVPGNLALALSVEFPTAISVANIGAYNDASTYLGYFDPAKCYSYLYNSGSPSSSYFTPAAFANGSNSHSCSGYWSGNFMNWASMQTIDPFRWALSGGYRIVDSLSQTILEKAWGSTQGSAGSNFNYRGTAQGGSNNLSASLVSKVTPFSNWNGFNSAIWGNGNTMVFSSNGGNYTLPTGTACIPLLLLGVCDLTNDVTTPNTGASNQVFRVYIRVDVCNPSTPLGLGGLESNCTQYPAATIPPSPGPFHYKPEGLIQQYASKIRYSAFSYLYGGGNVDQGAVLRAPMGFVGPTYPQPLATGVINNPKPEWDATTGMMSPNPDPATAAGSGVSKSGVMNFLNSFGETSKQYMTYDNVSELYYAVVRYYENLGNVPEWIAPASGAALDGYPAVQTWTDPIAYSCQKNFVLGIGDDHTWYDYNVGGNTNVSQGRPMPVAVAADSFNKASSWTQSLQTLEGISPTPLWPFDSGATYFIAGLAYGVHVNDIRSDLTGSQTLNTFWMDVEEGGGPENLNPYYLASKYGGFSVPTGYTIGTALTQSSWDTTGTSIVMNGPHTHLLPDNYFLAGNANGMVSGLKSAFGSIANSIKQLTTSFSFAANNVATAGTLSFSTQYDPLSWNGVVTANTLTFDSGGNPINTFLWVTSTTMQAQLAGTGWDTGRNVITFNGSTGVPFRVANLTSSQLSALLPSYSTGPSTAQAEKNYLNYLRGDQTNEVNSTASGSTQSLRSRTLLMGDVVDAALLPVAAPQQIFSQGNDPGYPAFKAGAAASRPTMVYAAANDGMLHAFVGTTGQEQFAYVPSGTFQGPNNTPQVDGLAEIGKPNYVHHYYVDASPLNYDVDLNHTYGASGSPNWVTMLIGGLGKGGRSYYALNITDPTSITEATAASTVMWEFSDSTMGYSFGQPVVVKTVKYGWVVILTSGYNTPDGYGYIYFVNPATGALLEKVRTPTPSDGLAQATAYVQDYSDDTADSLYVGDLNGQVWRFNLLGNSGSYPPPVLLATLTDASNNPQPITTAPDVEIHPTTRLRYVMVGTGKLLATTDVIATKMNSFYAILDGTGGAFLPVSTPVTRSQLVPVTTANLLGSGITIPPGMKGWYLDLGIDPVSGIAWRVILNPQSYNGITSFATLLTTADACSPSGNSRVYALNYATTVSVLQPSPIAFRSYPDAVINDRFTGGNGNPEIVIGFNSNSPPTRVPADLTSTLATRLLNWREVPTAD